MGGRWKGVGGLHAIVCGEGLMGGCVLLRGTRWKEVLSTHRCSEWVVRPLLVARVSIVASLRPAAHGVPRRVCSLGCVAWGVPRRVCCLGCVVEG